MKFSLFQVNKMSSSYSLIMNKKHTNHLFIMKTIIYLHLINIDYYERTVEACHIWSARKKPVSDGRKGYYQHLVESPEILVISDIRRCGKSVLLSYLANRRHSTSMRYKALLAGKDYSEQVKWWKRTAWNDILPGKQCNKTILL